MRDHIRSFVAIVLVISVLGGVITSCSDSSGRSSRRRDRDEEIPHDMILYSETYNNGAWGLLYDRWFITTEGEVYYYDSSTSEYMYAYYCDNAVSGYSGDLDQLIMRYTDPVTTISEEQVQQIYKLASRLKPDMVFESVSAACDAGSHVEKVLINDEGDMIAIRETGDNEGELREAKSLLDYLDDEVCPQLEQANGSIYTSIYTCDDLPVYEFSEHLCPEGRYVAINVYELEGLISSGIEQIDEEILANDEFVFFIDSSETSTTGYRVFYDAIIFSDGMAQMIPSPDNYAPDETEMVGDAICDFCSVICVPRSIAEQYMTEDGGYVDMNGNEYTRVVIYE